MTYSNCILAFVFTHALLGVCSAVADEPAGSEPMTVTFDRSCAAPLTQEEPSGPGVVKPRMSPKYPPRNPKLPEDAKPGEKGVVKMWLLVNEEGYVTKAQLLKSSGSAALDRGALVTTGDWRLEPGRVDGKATCLWMTFTFSWQ